MEEKSPWHIREPAGVRDVGESVGLQNFLSQRAATARGAVHDDGLVLGTDLGKAVDQRIDGNISSAWIEAVTELIGRPYINDVGSGVDFGKDAIDGHEFSSLSDTDNEMLCRSAINEVNF